MFWFPIAVIVGLSPLNFSGESPLMYGLLELLGIYSYYMSCSAAEYCLNNLQCVFIAYVYAELMRLLPHFLPPLQTRFLGYSTVFIEVVPLSQHSAEAQVETWYERT